MRKITILLGFIILFVCSLIYDQSNVKAVKPLENNEQCYVILEGAFKQKGTYVYHNGMTIKELIKEVGIEANANLEALDQSKALIDESTLYLPIINKYAVSLNSATPEQLMTLERVGEKTAQKIIDYRNKTPFTSTDEIMNISGIGEKTYLRLRDYLVL